jgi:hypothetical protein
MTSRSLLRASKRVDEPTSEPLRSTINLWITPEYVEALANRGLACAVYDRAKHLCAGRTRPDPLLRMVIAVHGMSSELPVIDLRHG